MAENAKVQSPQPEAGSSSATTPVTISQIAIAATLKAIADNGNRREWDQKIHCRAITHLAIAHGLPRERAKEFCAVLAHKGLGGNASQYRQWLEATGEKGPGLVDPVPKAGALASDF